MEHSRSHAECCTSEALFPRLPLLSRRFRLCRIPTPLASLGGNYALPIHTYPISVCREILGARVSWNLWLLAQVFQYDTGNGWLESDIYTWPDMIEATGLSTRMLAIVNHCRVVGQAFTQSTLCSRAQPKASSATLGKLTMATCWEQSRNAKGIE